VAVGGWATRIAGRDPLNAVPFGESPAAFTIGAVATDPTARPFSAGACHERAILAFWVAEARRTIRPDDRFVIWYGRDIGAGRIVEVGDQPPSG